MLTRRGLLRSVGIAAPAIIASRAMAQFNGCKPGFCIPQPTGSACSAIGVTDIWNTSDKTAGITLSNSNTTANAVNIGGGIRSLGSHTTGKWYVELTVNTMTGNIFQNDGIGLCIASTPLNNLYSNPTDLFIRSTDGHVYNGNNAELAALTQLQGQIISIAYDGDLGKTWVRSNLGTVNVWRGNGVGASGDPATGTTGFPSPFGGDPVFLFMGGDGGTTDVVTINQTLAYSPPFGFCPW